MHSAAKPPPRVHSRKSWSEHMSTLYTFTNAATGEQWGQYTLAPPAHWVRVLAHAGIVLTITTEER